MHLLLIFHASKTFVFLLCCGDLDSPSLKTLNINLPLMLMRNRQCLASSLKIDAFGVNKEAVSLLAMAGEERACLALR